MKTIGLIGGMSWESTTSYYQIINQGIKQKLGGLHSAKVVLVSIDFAEIEQLQRAGDWTQMAEILIDAAKSLEAAGADFFLICTNTMHKVATQVEQAVSIPLLHIANATGEELIENNITKVGLLGTKFTMQQDFYKHRLRDKYDLEVFTPNLDEQDIIHQVIYQELCLGKVKQNSREQYINIIQNLTDIGSQGIILGCTEIGLLINHSNSNTALFDTTFIHAQAAIKEALS
ncbi:aspartate/glutamate racemase family protein [Paraglaciecola aquimarina]|uniref:Aspartate/glutamate racemase family protein n=1 Tax=Paraglaciecola algarum TaxID=3050085 RepID=A0ABS9DDJ5_9ALTE|nr:aspartate/glutamate racemase family protein [Paraglaciecola sp. G1-23]MCF2949839.1 aspartate/glutamate racemase family protein [Paraglaciecola sp. G1-23]